MANKKPYDEVSVIRILSKNRDIEFKGKVILVKDNSVTVGNGTWGKIDYLCKYCGYSYSSSQFNKHRVDKSINYPKVKEVNTSNADSPKTNKINLVSKSIIKIPKY